MTKKELYELETDAYKNIDRIKREQEEYIKGVEYGISLMFEKVRRCLAKEEEKTAMEEKKINNCDNCAHKNKNYAGCKICITSYDKNTNTHSTPSHWELKKSEDTE